jgi:heme exporter protein D
MTLDAATVLLQWAGGGLLFLWVTTRRREVGIGYGWLLRSVYLAMAVGAVAAGRALDPVPVRDLAAAGVAVAAGVALVVSVVRRRAGVAGERERQERRSARVTAMTGIDRQVAVVDRDVAEFPPSLDLIAPVIAVVGLVAAGLDAGGSPALAVLRTLVGAAFLGAVSDAMLLGHWYLVQPGLARGPLLELVRWVTVLWPVEVTALLLPTGMPAVLSGSVDDGYGGLLGWFWVACAITTLALCLLTRAALRERYYSAVMAATGLLYLAILTAFGTDLVARAVLAG